MESAIVNIIALIISIFLIVVFAYLIGNLNSINASGNVEGDSVSTILIIDIILLVGVVVMTIYFLAVVIIGQGDRNKFKNTLVNFTSGGLIGDTTPPANPVKWSDVFTATPKAPEGTKSSIFSGFGLGLGKKSETSSLDFKDLDKAVGTGIQTAQIH